MRWEYIGAGLGLIAIGLTLMVALPPAWAPKMNPQLVQAGILTGLVLLLVGLGITIIGTWAGLPQNKLGPIFFLVLGALFIGTGSVWFYISTSSNAIDDKSRVSFLLECFQSPLPSTIPAGGFVSVIPIRFGEEGTVGFGGQAGPPGEKISWPEDWLKKWIGTTARCQLTSYADAPIFNVNLPITVTFKRIKRGDNPSNFAANETINTVDISLPITKIYPGKDSPFTFYIYNQGLDVVQIEFRRAPTFSFLGETTIKEGHLVQPNDFTRTVSLWPFRDPKDILGEDVPNDQK
jgi:hypothetical protein